MTKKLKITIIFVAVAVVLSVVLGITFAPCTVTLDYNFTPSDIVYNPFLPNDAELGKPYITKTKVTRFSTYSPPRGYVWYKDAGCTIPWVSGDKVTGNITLYAG